MVIGLNELRSGQSGVVRGVAGGFGIVRRLESLGLRPGKVVTKISSQFLAGPVTVMVDGRQLAIGRGMAAKVQVEVVSQH
ncbi:MAG: ferrous iron transport protein A [Desulfobacteraceae bacterium]|nr:ferrous iron transport protein A [Desulfobacteraceae bacterium]